jgi:hypothetical protein
MYPEVLYNKLLKVFIILIVCDCQMKTITNKGNNKITELRIICLHNPLNFMASYPVTFCAFS